MNNINKFIEELKETDMEGKPSLAKGMEKWDEIVGDLVELEGKQLISMTEWEVQFCDDIADQLDKGHTLTLKQIEVIRNLEDKYL